MDEHDDRPTAEGDRGIRPGDLVKHIWDPQTTGIVVYLALDGTGTVMWTLEGEPRLGPFDVSEVVDTPTLELVARTDPRPAVAEVHHTHG